MENKLPVLDNSKAVTTVVVLIGHNLAPVSKVSLDRIFPYALLINLTNTPNTRPSVYLSQAIEELINNNKSVKELVIINTGFKTTDTSDKLMNYLKCSSVYNDVSNKIIIDLVAQEFGYKPLISTARTVTGEFVETLYNHDEFKQLGIRTWTVFLEDSDKAVYLERTLEHLVSSEVKSKNYNPNYQIKFNPIYGYSVVELIGDSQYIVIQQPSWY